jgi:hypothetical protein
VRACSWFIPSADGRSSAARNYASAGVLVVDGCQNKAGHTVVDIDRRCLALKPVATLTHELVGAGMGKGSKDFPLTFMAG